MIHINKNPSGKLRSFRFGLAQLLDGLVRSLSLGWLFTDFPLAVSRRDARARFKRMKEEFTL